jgi:hypothetical protein
MDIRFAPQAEQQFDALNTRLRAPVLMYLERLAAKAPPRGLSFKGAIAGVSFVAVVASGKRRDFLEVVSIASTPSEACILQ